MLGKGSWSVSMPLWLFGFEVGVLLHWVFWFLPGRVGRGPAALGLLVPPGASRSGPAALGLPVPTGASEYGLGIRVHAPMALRVPPGASEYGLGVRVHAPLALRVPPGASEYGLGVRVHAPLQGRADPPGASRCGLEVLLGGCGPALGVCGCVHVCGGGVIWLK